MQQASCEVKFLVVSGQLRQLPSLQYVRVLFLTLDTRTSDQFWNQQSVFGGCTFWCSDYAGNLKLFVELSCCLLGAARFL